MTITLPGWPSAPSTKTGIVELSNTGKAGNLFVDITIGNTTQMVDLAELSVAVQAFVEFRKMTDLHLLP